MLLWELYEYKTQLGVLDRKGCSGCCVAPARCRADWGGVPKVNDLALSARFLVIQTVHASVTRWLSDDVAAHLLHAVDPSKGVRLAMHMSTMPYYAASGYAMSMFLHSMTGLAVGSGGALDRPASRGFGEFLADQVPSRLPVEPGQSTVDDMEAAARNDPAGGGLRDPRLSWLIQRYGPTAFLLAMLARDLEGQYADPAYADAISRRSDQRAWGDAPWLLLTSLVGTGLMDVVARLEHFPLAPLLRAVDLPLAGLQRALQRGSPYDLVPAEPKVEPQAGDDVVVLSGGQGERRTRKWTTIAKVGAGKDDVELMGINGRAIDLEWHIEGYWQCSVGWRYEKTSRTHGPGPSRSTCPICDCPGALRQICMPAHDGLGQRDPLRARRMSVGLPEPCFQDTNGLVTSMLSASTLAFYLMERCLPQDVATSAAAADGTGESARRPSPVGSASSSRRSASSCRRSVSSSRRRFAERSVSSSRQRSREHSASGERPTRGQLISRDGKKSLLSPRLREGDSYSLARSYTPGKQGISSDQPRPRSGFREALEAGILRAPEIDDRPQSRSSAVLPRRTLVESPLECAESTAGRLTLPRAAGEDRPASGLRGSRLRATKSEFSPRDSAVDDWFLQAEQFQSDQIRPFAEARGERHES